MAARSDAPPLPARLSAAAPWGLPSTSHGRRLWWPRDRLARGLRGQRHVSGHEVINDRPCGSQLSSCRRNRA
jgi:hypothetical protein